MSIFLPFSVMFTTSRFNNEYANRSFLAFLKYFSIYCNLPYTYPTVNRGNLTKLLLRGEQDRKFELRSGWGFGAQACGPCWGSDLRLSQDQNLSSISRYEGKMLGHSALAGGQAFALAWQLPPDSCVFEHWDIWQVQKHCLVLEPHFRFGLRFVLLFSLYKCTFQDLQR